VLIPPALWLAAILTFIGPALCAAADLPKIAPESLAWTAASGFSFPQAKKPDKVRRSLSGIACPPPTGATRRHTGSNESHIEEMRQGTEAGGYRITGRRKRLSPPTGTVGRHVRRRAYIIPHSQIVDRLDLTCVGSATADAGNRDWGGPGKSDR